MITYKHIFYFNKYIIYYRVNDPLKEITVCSGSSILYKNCISHNIVNFSIHEDYNIIANDYDIAVMKVTPPFTYNNSTKAVNLAPDNVKNVFKKWGVVCGWGYYSVMTNYYNINGIIQN